MRIVRTSGGEGGKCKELVKVRVTEDAKKGGSL